MPDEIDPQTNAESRLPEGQFARTMRTVRKWKPEGQEFTLDEDYAQLVVDLGEADMGTVEFDHVYEPLGDVPGHTLIAWVKVNSQE